MSFVLASVVIALTLATPPARAANIVPAGPEFRISRTGDVDYGFDGYAIYPRIASTNGGEFVVVWKSYFSGYASYGETVAARRLDGTATPMGPEFDVSLRYHDSLDPTLPDVAADASGGFVVVWSHFDDFDRDVTPPYESLRYRRYDGTGSPLETEVG